MNETIVHSTLFSGDNFTVIAVVAMAASTVIMLFVLLHLFERGKLSDAQITADAQVRVAELEAQADIRVAELESSATIQRAQLESGAVDPSLQAESRIARN